MTERLLGVDGGGTATEAWLAEPGCAVIGRGTSGPSNAKAVGLDAARRGPDAAIGAAFRDAGLAAASVAAACLGLAGFDRPRRSADPDRLGQRGATVALAGAGQRRRPRGRGRHAGGLGRRVDRGHRLDRRGRTPDGARAPGAGGTSSATRGAPTPPSWTPSAWSPAVPMVASRADRPRSAHRSPLPGPGRRPAVPGRHGAVRADLAAPDRLAGPRGPGGLRRVARGRGPAPGTRRSRAGRRGRRRRPRWAGPPGASPWPPPAAISSPRRPCARRCSTAWRNGIPAGLDARPGAGPRRTRHRRARRTAPEH